MGNKYYLDSISHYGILGMHHGVRNYQYKDGSLTPAGRERYGVGPARDKNGTPYPVEDKVLPKGTKLNSIEYALNPSDWTKHPEESAAYKKKWKYTYNPKNEWDSKVYRGPFSVYKSNRGQYLLEDVSYEVKRDLKMPDSKERYEAFKKVYDENKKVAVKDLSNVQGILKSYGFSEYPNERDRKSATVDLSNLKTEDDYKAAYDVFNHAMDNVEAFKTTKKYKKLMEKNFDAMVDDNNQGVYNDAQDPIIIFNRKDLKKLGSTDYNVLANMYKNYTDVKTELNKKGKAVKL